MNHAGGNGVIVDPTFGDLLDAYIAEENLIEIKRPGDRNARNDEVAFSTAASYLSLCNQLRMQCGQFKLDELRPLRFQNWLKSLKAEPKTKGHLKAFAHRLFKKAKLYGFVDFHENPIALVEIRGISKRASKPTVLTIDQFFLIASIDSRALPQHALSRAMHGPSRRRIARSAMDSSGF